MLRLLLEHVLQHLLLVLHLVRVDLRIVRNELWLHFRVQRLRGRHNGLGPDNGSDGSGASRAVMAPAAK